VSSAPREARIPGYRRRSPPDTLLHDLVREHLETFLSELETHPGFGLPAFCKRELRRYLECGILANGFVRVSCTSCKRDSLVAFSCKGRGFCPSCGGRRMSHTAAHLIAHVLPEACHRQWVLTLPFALRLRCAYDRELCAAVRTIFVRAVFSHLARQARALGIPSGAKGHRAGAVNVIQRFGGALNLNVHFHALFVEGVYTRAGRCAPARFHELPPPTVKDVERVLARIHSRLRKLLQRRSEDDRDEEPLDVGDLLTHLASASVGGRQALGKDGQRLEGLFAPVAPEQVDGSDKPVALVARGGGFSLHAGVAVPPDRRGRLEKLCRYIARPPLALARLRLDERGRILYELRHPCSDGRTHVVFTPREFLARLCALIPYPRTHLVTYHGVLAPASSWRDEVVPSPTNGVRARHGSQKAMSLDRRLRWAELMKRTFEIDVLRCECGAERRVIALITDPGTARRILEHLGLPSEPPPSAPSRAPPMLAFE